MFEQQRRVRIVIADDDAGVRRDLRDLLDITGTAEIVGEAADGLESIDEARRHSPDAVVLDVAMPALDGLAAARRIKAQMPACRVVVLTVFGDETTRLRAEAAGVDAFVIKGAPLSELLRAICSLPPTDPARQGGFS